MMRFNCARDGEDKHSEVFTNIWIAEFQMSIGKHTFVLYKITSRVFSEKNLEIKRFCFRAAAFMEVLLKMAG